MKTYQYLAFVLLFVVAHPLEIRGQVPLQSIAEEVLLDVEERRQRENRDGANVQRILLSAGKTVNRHYHGDHKLVTEWDPEVLAAVVNQTRRRGVEELEFCQGSCGVSPQSMRVRLSEPTINSTTGHATIIAEIAGTFSETRGYANRVQYQLKRQGNGWVIVSSKQVYHASTRIDP